ncbi:MAG: HD domain-containing protein [Coprococcus sp.]
MSYPSIEQAKKIIEECYIENARSGIRHGEYTAEAAKQIAFLCGMDADKSYVMGLLHDIGRNYTDGQFRHMTVGYEVMLEKGYDEVARICLTHSFPVQNIYSYVGKVDVDFKEQKKYQDILKNIVYDDYDKLIQLCDSISTNQGFVLPEQRFIGLAFKYGMNDFTIERWNAVLQLKEYFGNRIGQDVNKYIKNRFGEECLY